MHQPSNVREIKWQPEDFRAQPAAIVSAPETFIVIYGSKENSAHDDLYDRASVIEAVDGGEFSIHKGFNYLLTKIVAFSLETGKCRDATQDICDVVIERWAQDGKLLTEKQKEWVAQIKDEVFANCFRMEK